MPLLQGDGLVRAGYEITHGSLPEENRLWAASYASDREPFVVAAAVSYNKHLETPQYPSDEILSHIDYLLQQETYGPVKAVESRIGDIHELTHTVKSLRHEYRQLQGIGITALIGPSLVLSCSGEGRVAIAGRDVKPQQLQHASPMSSGELRTMREPVVVPKVGSLLVAFATSGNRLPFRPTDSVSTALIRSYNSAGAYITRQETPITEPDFSS